MFRVVSVVAVACVALAGCAPAVDDRAVAREAVDAVYLDRVPALVEVDGYDELADGLVDDAADNCDTVGLYLSGLRGDQLLEDAFLAAVAVVC